MRTIQLLIFLLIVTSCEQPVEKMRGIPSDSRVEAEIKNLNLNAEELKEKGYQVFTYKEEDTTYLMQQYYIVFLKKGENRSQDSTAAAKLQEQHMAHLTRMYNEVIQVWPDPWVTMGKYVELLFITPQPKEKPIVLPG